jgi:16S rRNA (adenine1518-N6/adenine1519-N6)-dimethyltransferase
MTGAAGAGEGERDTVLARLRRAGLRPRKALGQHFLHDPKILEAIAEAARLDPSDAVLEVGTGPATLTRILAARAGRVLTVELDREMLAFAREELAGADNVRFLEADALDGKGGLNPALQEELVPLGPFKLVANLPYAIATPLILALLESAPGARLLVATVQKEFALRLAAPPGTRDYGPATVIVALRASIEIVKALPPGCFWPPPAVSSAVIRIEPRAPRADGALLPAAAAWAHRLLGHRRKQVGGLLRAALGAEGASEALGLLGIPAGARPDAIPPEGFVRLAQRWH